MWEHGNLDEVLESLENFEVRYPNLLGTEQKLFYVLGGMSAGDKIWNSADMMAVIRYFTPNFSKGESNGRTDDGTEGNLGSF